MSHVMDEQKLHSLCEASLHYDFSQEFVKRLSNVPFCRINDLFLICPCILKDLPGLSKKEVSAAAQGAATGSGYQAGGLARGAPGLPESYVYKRMFADDGNLLEGG